MHIMSQERAVRSDYTNLSKALITASSHLLLDRALMIHQLS